MDGWIALGQENLIQSGPNTGMEKKTSSSKIQKQLPTDTRIIPEIAVALHRLKRGNNEEEVVVWTDLFCHTEVWWHECGVNPLYIPPLWQTAVFSYTTGTSLLINC